MKKKVNLKFHSDSIRKASCQGRKINNTSNTRPDKQIDKTQIAKTQIAKAPMVKKKAKMQHSGERKIGLTGVLKKLNKYISGIWERKEEK